MNPQVFVSHASEDKDRFVIEFATKLRSKGIEAWVDQWEIYPGDSLVEKIFEEGLKNAEAVIVVVSQHSVKKPWVRQELNTSIVKKINGLVKLIPVIIDIEKDEIPEALNDIVWVRIQNLQEYNKELNQIVSTIYGYREKPPLGSAPAYTQTIVNTIPALNKIDSLIMKTLGEQVVKNGHRWLTPTEIKPATTLLDISQEALTETLQILDRRYYIEIKQQYADDVHLLEVTHYGFEQYAKTYIPNYDKLIRLVSSKIVNQGLRDFSEIVSVLQQSPFIIEHILDELNSEKLVQISKSLGGRISINSLSPELKRRLE